MATEIGSLSGPSGAENSVRKQQYMEKVGQEREVPVWELPDAPPGSTSESLLVFERGIPVRVAGPTHYMHLADGRVMGGYGGGTLYSEPVLDDAGNIVGEKLTRVTANHAAE
ncbi:MAG TPA: hypothetical protein VGR98_27950 [Streptosporangiaceae bacterium]|nr:hypothetical protein [Streptosporangiaceae bacterium]